MKGNKLTLLFVVITMMFPTTLMAQETQTQTTTTAAQKESFFKKSNITYGGNLGVHLNSNEFNILVMPEIGYKLFPQWKFALAPMYSYYGFFNDDRVNDEEHVAGVRISTTFDVTRNRNTSKSNFFIYLGYQYEHHWINYTYSGEYDVNFADLGVGLRFRLSDRTSAYLLASWHAYAEHNSEFDTRYERNWFPELIPNISVGIEINN